MNEQQQLRLLNLVAKHTHVHNRLSQKTHNMQQCNSEGRSVSMQYYMLQLAASNPSQGNANTTQGEAEGQDDPVSAAQPSMEDLIEEADGEIAHDEETPVNGIVNEDEIHNDEDNAEDANDNNDVAELPRPTRPNPNYIADREPFHTPGYKHKSKPPL